MSYELAVDLILRALYESDVAIVSTAAQLEFEGSGTIAPPVTDGFGVPVFVGGNSSLSLVLDVLDVPNAGTYAVSVETAASPTARRWRKLGAFPVVSAIGSTPLALSGADAWVRGRYTPSAGVSMAMGVRGTAQLVMLAPSAQSSDGTSTPVDLAQYRSARMTLTASSVAGVLCAVLETAGSASAAVWRECSEWVKLTAPGAADLAGVNLDRYLRVRWTLSGTATFGVAGLSRLVLAQPSDRARLGVNGDAFPNATLEEEDDALYAATSDILGPWESRYTMPPRAWQDDVRRACIAVCDWQRIAARGTEPGTKITAQDTVYYERYVTYMGNPGSVTTAGTSGWVQRVADKKANPHGFLDSATPDPVDGGVERVSMHSQPLRGWGARVPVL